MTLNPLVETIIAVVGFVLIIVLLIGSIVAVRRGMKAGVHTAVVGALRKNSRRVMVLVAGTTVILVGIIISPVLRKPHVALKALRRLTHLPLVPL